MRMWIPDRPGALGTGRQPHRRRRRRRGRHRHPRARRRSCHRRARRRAPRSPTSSTLLVAEIDQVDGVDVENIAPAADSLHDPRLDALETAAHAGRRVVPGRGAPMRCAAHGANHRRGSGSAWSTSTGPTSSPQQGDVPVGGLAGRLREGQPVVGPGRGGRRSAPTTWSGPRCPGADMALVLGRDGKAVPCAGAAPGGSAGADRRHQVSRAARLRGPAVAPRPGEPAVIAPEARLAHHRRVSWTPGCRELTGQRRTRSWPARRPRRQHGVAARRPRHGVVAGCDLHVERPVGGDLGDDAQTPSASPAR